jgi:hypothetical protein
MNTQSIFKGLVAISLTVSLGACANEFATVSSPGYFAQNGKTFDATSVKFQDEVTSPICDLFVKETTPGRWVTIGAHAFNNGVGGAVAATASLEIQSNVLKAALKKTALPATAASSLVFYGIMGGIGGNDAYNARKFGNTQVCLKSAAGGLQSVPPSLARAIRDGRVSEHQLANLLQIDAKGGVTFGDPRNWGTPIASAARDH